MWERLDLLIITIDTREPQEIRNYIKKKFNKITIKEAALKEGDILIECENDKHTKVLVERKRCSDLYGSVFGSKGHTARFPSQCARLITHQCNSVVVLLITDSVRDFVDDMWKYKKMKVDADVFDSIIASVMTRYNIRVLVNPDKYKGIEQAIRVGIKVCEGNLDLVAHRNCDALIARFLNITMTQWRAIREVYGTDLTYIAGADLSCVKGIGKVKEKRIKELLVGKSADWMD